MPLSTTIISVLDGIVGVWRAQRDGDDGPGWHYWWCPLCNLGVTTRQTVAEAYIGGWNHIRGQHQ